MWDLIVSVPDHCLSFFFSFLFFLELVTCSLVSFYVLYVCCRGRTVNNIRKTCGPTPYLI